MSLDLGPPQQQMLGGSDINNLEYADTQMNLIVGSRLKKLIVNAALPSKLDTSIGCLTILYQGISTPPVWIKALYQ